MAEPRSDEMLEALSAAIAAVKHADEPYWAGVAVAGLANSMKMEFGVAYRLWWIWTLLADWYELNPEERPQAVAAMRRSAGEWSTVAMDGPSRDAYLDRWLRDVAGPDHRIGQEF